MVVRRPHPESEHQDNTRTTSLKRLHEVKGDHASVFENGEAGEKFFDFRLSGVKHRKELLKEGNRYNGGLTAPKL